MLNIKYIFHFSRPSLLLAFHDSVIKSKKYRKLDQDVVTHEIMHRKSERVSLLVVKIGAIYNLRRSFDCLIICMSYQSYFGMTQKLGGKEQTKTKKMNKM